MEENDLGTWRAGKLRQERSRSRGSQALLGSEGSNIIPSLCV